MTIKGGTKPDSKIHRMKVAKAERARLGDFKMPSPPVTHRLRISRNASPQLEYALRESQRQEAVVYLQELVIRVGQLSVAELSKAAQFEGLELMIFTQDLMEQAMDDLNPDYLSKYKVFSNHSLEAGARSILQLQYLGLENIEEILSHLPDWRILPPERKGIIRKLFDALFASGEEAT